MLRDQAINVLVAGRDTTASLLSWTLLMLARHKPVFYKLRQVIIEEFGNGEDVSNITFESLKRCEYLRYVLNETLRLYPTVPNNFRYALKDTSLPRGGGKDGTGPIFIPKTPLFCTVYTVCTEILQFGDTIPKSSDQKDGLPNQAPTHGAICLLTEGLVFVLVNNLHSQKLDTLFAEYSKTFEKLKATLLSLSQRVHAN